MAIDYGQNLTRLTSAYPEGRSAYGGIMANIFGSSSVREGARIGKTFAARRWSYESSRDCLVLSAILSNRDVSKMAATPVGANDLWRVQLLLEGERNDGIPSDFYTRLHHCFRAGQFYRYLAPYYVSSMMCCFSLMSKSENHEVLGPGNCIVLSPRGDVIRESDGWLTRLDDEVGDWFVSKLSGKVELEKYSIQDLIVYRHVKNSPFKYDGFVGVGFWLKEQRLSFDGIPYVRASEAAPALPRGFVMPRTYTNRESGLVDHTSYSTDTNIIGYAETSVEGDLIAQVAVPTNALTPILRMGRIFGDSLGSAPIASGGATLPMGASGNFIDAINVANDGDSIWMYAPKKSEGKEADPIEAISLENAIDGIIFTGGPARCFRADAKRGSVTEVLDQVGANLSVYNGPYLSTYCVYVSSRQSGNRNVIWAYSMIGEPTQFSGLLQAICGEKFPRISARLNEAGAKRVVIGVGDRITYVLDDTESFDPGKNPRLLYSYRYTGCEGTWHTGEKPERVHVKGGPIGKFDEVFKLDADSVNGLKPVVWSIGVPLKPKGLQKREVAKGTINLKSDGKSLNRNME